MEPRALLVKGESVRVEGHDGPWVVIREEHATNSAGQTFVEVYRSANGVLLVASAKCHRGHYEWVDDD